MSKATKRTDISSGVQVSFWTLNGSPLTEDIIEQVESAIERVSIELFNQGIRVATQTTRG